MLRHGKGYELASKGVDTRAIQVYLGHKNIQHTVLYTSSIRSGLKASAKMLDFKFFPMTFTISEFDLVPADPTQVRELQGLLKKLVRAVVKRDSTVLEQLLPDWKNAQESVFAHIDQYPDKLIFPPEAAFSAISYDDEVFLPDGWDTPMVYIIPRSDKDWGVDCFLWTKAEGQCELACVFDVEWKRGKPKIVYLAGVHCP
jgi:hypothetical protein